jgi:hypothetical protein
MIHGSLSTLTISKRTLRVTILMLSAVCCRMSIQIWELRRENQYNKSAIIVLLPSSLDRRVVVDRLRKIFGNFVRKMRE